MTLGSLVSRPTVSSAVDKCTFDIPTKTGDVGWAHTHPFFVWSAESTETIMCGTNTVHLSNFTEVNNENLTMDFFSDNDIAISSISYPGYLKTLNIPLQKCPGDC